MRKSTKTSIILGALAAALVAGIIYYNYNLDQTRARGLAFGNEILGIQDDLEDAQRLFDSNLRMYEDGRMTREDFLGFAQRHVSDMTDIISRYDFLEPPDTFEASVRLLRLSTETQLEAEMLVIEWARHGDESDLVRADALYQQAFENELTGLSAFNSAKSGVAP